MINDNLGKKEVVMEFCKESDQLYKSNIVQYKYSLMCYNRRDSVLNKSNKTSRSSYSSIEKARSLYINNNKRKPSREPLLYPTAKSQEPFCPTLTQCKEMVKVKGKEPRQRRTRKDRKIECNI